MAISTDKLRLLNFANLRRLHAAPRLYSNWLHGPPFPLPPSHPSFPPLPPSPLTLLATNPCTLAHGMETLGEGEGGSDARKWPVLRRTCLLGSRGPSWFSWYSRWILYYKLPSNLHDVPSHSFIHSLFFLLLFCRVVSTLPLPLPPIVNIQSFPVSCSQLSFAADSSLSFFAVASTTSTAPCALYLNI